MHRRQTPEFGSIGLAVTAVLGLAFTGIPSGFAQPPSPAPEIGIEQVEPTEPATDQPCCGPAAVPQIPSAPDTENILPFYRQVELTADRVGVARGIDARLRNPWGLAFGLNTPIWVANNGSGVISLYGNEGQFYPNAISPRIVLVPNAPKHPTQSTASPTGIIYNRSEDFTVRADSRFGPSRFIIATGEGIIAGWSPAVSADRAIVAVDRSGLRAVYKGLAAARSPAGHFIYVTNFRDGVIEAFDALFRPAQLRGTFRDPALPAGYAPHGIRRIGESIYVTYARQDNDQRQAVAGTGRGYISEFTADGEFLRRFASSGPLNAPWGMAVAPQNFGPYSGALLVANSGDGRISAYNLRTGDHIGQLGDAEGRPLAIPGLHALAFRISTTEELAMEQRRQLPNLYFTAGPSQNRHGLLGRIEYVPQRILGTPVGPAVTPPD